MVSVRCKGRLLWEKGQIEDLYSELESGKLDCKIRPIYKDFCKLFYFILHIKEIVIFFFK